MHLYLAEAHSIRGHSGSPLFVNMRALTASSVERSAETRTGKTRRRLLVGLLRQSVFGRLAGYEDMHDAVKVRLDTGKAARFSASGGSQRALLHTRRAICDCPTRPERAILAPRHPESGECRIGVSLRMKACRVLLAGESLWPNCTNS
jgi:hypothetical protein